MTDKNIPTEGAPEAEATMLSRRKMLKLGAASAPVVISLQSGTAWAQSVTCEQRVIFPEAGGSNDQALIDLLKHEAGYTNPEAEAAVADPSGPFSSPAYDGGDGHNAFLRAEVTSCWTSMEYRGVTSGS